MEGEGGRYRLTREWECRAPDLVTIEINHVKTEAIGIGSLVHTQADSGQTLIPIADKIEVVHR